MCVYACVCSYVGVLMCDYLCRQSLMMQLTTVLPDAA